MILRREHLRQHPSVFRAMTGLTAQAFDDLLPELLGPSPPTAAGGSTARGAAAPSAAATTSTSPRPTSSC
jgi:hypothetical protein